MIEILPAAVERIEELREQAGVDTVLSVTIDIGGPSGVHPSITLDGLYPFLDEDYKKDYDEYEVAGIPVILEKVYSKYVEDLIIDHHEGLDRSGFVISRKVAV